MTEQTWKKHANPWSVWTASPPRRAHHLGGLAFGTMLLVPAQLWRIDRYGLLFDQRG
ncbi:hypothetical protein ACFWYW_59220 [Nonomuraea sp. NPDC059023]|uniref:hypothetical protein n=1 Tax=Nonomuraea sp. NPDC059023 TaxID=3346706 RepID=UPI003683210D